MQGVVTPAPGRAGHGSNRRASPRADIFRRPRRYLGIGCRIDGGRPSVSSIDGRNTPLTGRAPGRSDRGGNGPKAASRAEKKGRGRLAPQTDGWAP